MVISALLAEWSQALPQIVGKCDQRVRMRERLVSGDAVLEIFEVVVRIDRRDDGYVRLGEADVAIKSGSLGCRYAQIQVVPDVTQLFTEPEPRRYALNESSSD